MPLSRHILYIDDNKDSCELVEAILRFSDLNYKVTTAESSEEAISLIVNQSFDLLIMDYLLPQMSGIELCRYVRQSDLVTPIIFFTAMARPVDRINGLEAGANEYLVKPNDLEKLVETINRLIEKNPLANCVTQDKVNSQLS